MEAYKSIRLNETLQGVTSYNDLTDKPTIPTALSALTDDATHRLVTDNEKIKTQQSIIFTYNL